MNVAEKVEAAVGNIISAYPSGADFGKGSPEKYIIYEFVEKGGDYGDGTSHASDYMVTLNIFTPALDFKLYDEIKTAMQAIGFSFSGGGNADPDKAFPNTCHWYHDYGV